MTDRRSREREHIRYGPEENQRCQEAGMTDDWRAMIRLGVEELVDKAVTRGAKQSDVYAIVLEEIERLRVANDLDPDPADDDSGRSIEPANDWPGAEGRL
jgi:hypothetical protein